MNAKVRGEVDLRGIYIKGEARSGKIPARYPTKVSAVGCVSRRRMWGTRSRKNLMRARLKCCNARNVPWAVKKASFVSRRERQGTQGNYSNIEIFLSS